jgi:hypothetical protein
MLKAACNSHDRAAEVPVALAAGCSTEHRDWGLRTALHSAWSVEAITILLAHGANLEARDQWGYTPLFHANDGACVRVLLQAGANRDAVAHFNQTPIVYSTDFDYRCISSICAPTGVARQLHVFTMIVSDVSTFQWPPMDLSSKPKSYWPPVPARVWKMPWPWPTLTATRIATLPWWSCCKQPWPTLNKQTPAPRLLCLAICSRHPHLWASILLF